MRPIKRSGDPDIPNYRFYWRIEKFSCQSPCPNFGYQNIQFCFQYFYVGQPKIIADHPGYHLGGPQGDPGFFVSCSTGARMMWCQRVTQICDCNSNVSVPWTWRLLRHAWLQSCISWQKCHRSNYCDDEFSLSNQITSIGIYIFAQSFVIDYFANAFPYNYKTQHYQQDKFGTGTPHLADMLTTVHGQNSWKITGWSHGTVSMAMHCSGYNMLTPDRRLANHVFDAAAAVAVFGTGSEALFPDSPHRTTLETIPVETLPMTNVTHKLLDSRQQHMWLQPQAITRRSNDV